MVRAALAPYERECIRRAVQWIPDALHCRQKPSVRKHLVSATLFPMAAAFGSILMRLPFCIMQPNPKLHARLRRPHEKHSYYDHDPWKAHLAPGKAWRGGCGIERCSAQPGQRPKWRASPPQRQQRQD
jgi:hypothetical protein